MKLRFAPLALAPVLLLAACGGDDSVSFGPGSGGSGGATGGTGGGGTGGASGGTGGASGGTGGASGGTGGASGGTGGATGGTGGASGGTGGASGGTGGATGGTGGATGGTGGATGGTGGATGGTGGATGGTGGATGGTGGATGGTGGATGGTGGATGGTGGTGACAGIDCNDNDACTTDGCVNGACTHVKVDVNDNNACTVDLCDGVTGVAHVPETQLFFDDFHDNSAGWTLGTEWEIKPAVASSGANFGGNDPGTDHTPGANNGVAGVVVGGFPNKTAHGFYYLESPVIDTTKATPGAYVELRLWRFLNADYAPYMRSRIEVWDGAQWVVIWSTQSQPVPSLLIDAPPRGNGWYPMSFDVTSYKNAGFKLRVGFDVGNGQVYSVGGWTLDDISIVSSAVKTDADQCTTMVCAPGSGAQYSPLPVADGNACTVDACSTYGGLSHVPKTRAFFEDFADNNAGWTLGSEWEIGPAQASNCGSSTCGGNDPSTDHTSTNDNGVAGVVIGDCSSTVLHGDYCLTSPNINTSAEVGALSLAYYRHMHSDQSPYMVNHVDVSANGGSSWTQVWASGNACMNDGQWTLQSFDVGAYKSATFRVRFCHSVGQANAFDVGGFSVDDVSIYDPACITP